MRINATWRALGRVAALSLLSLNPSGSALAQNYSLTDLGPFADLAGRTDAKPNGINNQGQVSAANAVSGTYQALVYKGSWVNLGTLGGTSALAAGIEAAGKVAGYSQTGNGDMHAFLWTPGGTDGVPGNPQMKDLGTLGGGSSSEAFGINHGGSVTGYSDVPAHPAAQQHAFLYRGGTLTDIGSLINGLPNSFGYGINALDHITGTAYDNSYKTPHAFFYNGNTAVDIRQGAVGLSINDADHIVGYVTTNGFDHAYYYSAGVMTDLGTLGGHYSYALGINNSNAIVGGTFTDAKDSIYRAFIWANNTMSDLNTRLDASGSGWTLTEAEAINDAGQIVGLGTFGGGTHAFLLTPKTSQPTSPSITGVKVRGPDVLISFTTSQGAVYSLEAEPGLLNSTWATVTSGINGSGGVMTVTNSGGATLIQRFYRIKRTSP